MLAVQGKLAKRSALHCALSATARGHCIRPRACKTGQQAMRVDSPPIMAGRPHAAHNKPPPPTAPRDVHAFFALPTAGCVLCPCDLAYHARYRTSVGRAAPHSSPPLISCNKTPSMQPASGPVHKPEAQHIAHAGTPSSKHLHPRTNVLSVLSKPRRKSHRGVLSLVVIVLLPGTPTASARSETRLHGHPSAALVG